MSRPTWTEYVTPVINPPESEISQTPRSKYKPPRDNLPPIVDNFPLATTARSPLDLPPIPSYNRPPEHHVNESTPLFIGFTRNWLLLQQTVVSYITSGWPPTDIYVVENTGTMNANELGKLTLQNPFYLDHHRLTHIFGVNVISTPTYLSFAQLQNFYLHTAIQNNLEHYFWGHMDVAAVSEEDYEDPNSKQYETLYMRTVKELRRNLDPAHGRWAIKFFAYDRLALINRAAFEDVGGWDTMIPYYGTDCDMHERLVMAEYRLDDAKTGLVYDIGTSVDDLLVYYRRKPIESRVDEVKSKRSTAVWGDEDERASPAYYDLTHKLDVMQNFKNADTRGRNFWQASQSGGQGEPYYVDSEGFEKSVQMTIEHGRQVMAEKWGHRGCDLRASNLNAEDAWQVTRDWED